MNHMIEIVELTSTMTEEEQAQLVMFLRFIVEKKEGKLCIPPKN